MYQWASVQAMENRESGKYEWFNSDRTDVHQLSETGGFDQIAGLVRNLGRYLAISEPRDTPPEKLFASFGFESTGELLQLCSAVSPFSSRHRPSVVLTATCAVSSQLVYFVTT
jgi:hypothetical protein